MLNVDPKFLVKRLTPTATRALEAAVGRAAGGQFYEVSPEHFLLALVEPDDGDAALLFGDGQRNLKALRLRIERALASNKTGNPGRPVFSQSLFRWMTDAWLMASVEQGATALRTGALIVTWARQQGIYAAVEFPELEALASDEVKSGFERVLASGRESVELEATRPTGGAGISPTTAQPGTAALDRYTISFTAQARAGKIDPVLGRHREIREVISILCRRRKNNPIIVGEPGVGKTALVEGLALAIAQNEVPESLANVEVRGLDLGALQAGAGVRGEFENRLKAVIAEVKGSAVPVVLFIDEAHTLIGAGGAEGTADAANLLKPELARGELRTIAATTWSEYKKYFEKDAALERRFQPVKVDEPSESDAVSILRGIKPIYEKAHGVEILDEAVVAAVRLSQRYIAGRQLPDKAVDLLDSAAARVRIGLRTKPPALDEIDAQLADLRRARDAFEREERAGGNVDREEKTRVLAKIAELDPKRGELGARWEQEQAAVGKLREVRAALLQPEADASLRDALAAAQATLHDVRRGSALVHERVDAEAVAHVVEAWTGVPVRKLRTEAAKPVLELETRLRERVKGQDHAVQVVTETVQMAKAGVRSPDAPQGVLLFVGPSGVGKTETALALADLLYGGERFMTTINMSEFQEKHSVSRLIGSPPGYVGYGEGGVLSEAVRQRPYSVVLLDEVEKADLEVMNLFYQVFDKGVLNDGEGRAIDFKNTTVILTSNLASHEIMKLCSGERMPSSEELNAAIRPVLSRHFKPALLARMTIVPFRPMLPEVLRDIAQLKLGKLCDRIAATHKLKVSFSPETIDELARRCTEAETGARNLDHVLQGSLMPVLSRDLLNAMVAERTNTQLDINWGGEGWQIALS